MSYNFVVEYNHKRIVGNNHFAAEMMLDYNIGCLEIVVDNKIDNLAKGKEELVD